MMKGRLTRKKKQTEVDPMSGVFNLADVMLVFACGLMVALVLNWNVDISKNQKEIDITKGKDITGTEEFDKGNLEKSDDGNQYNKMGTVYQDPNTGKVYMIMDE